MDLTEDLEHSLAQAIDGVVCSVSAAPAHGRLEPAPEPAKVLAAPRLVLPRFRFWAGSELEPSHSGVKPDGVGAGGLRAD
jgi:hypothetical protein